MSTAGPGRLLTDAECERATELARERMARERWDPPEPRISDEQRARARAQVAELERRTGAKKR